ncbi:cysteine desulfurase [Bosea caraganae]|uniref:Cysteine desulfurase n=1 Tax=Bosea caraganae TaxID=2763117 RepID=A0A370L1V5_9HYPH|nr:cysteine desulfurase [Bosea caraganae]RDJ21350.1 cysteine desulfurase [Bosea caraganae]RDJ26490.1 cysteine desulfurase [Bosea caraganae]
MNAPVKPYDVEAIRRDFPILSREVYGKKLVYLDNAASAQKPEVVIEAMSSLMRENYSNVHRGLHYLANASTEAYEAARESARRFLNAAHLEEIIFTRSSTGGLNAVASSLGRHLQIQEGDEIIISVLEHHSNIVPWHFWRERYGAVLKFAPIDEDGNFLIEEFEKLISPRTKIVALTQMSNAIGTIVPIAEVAAICQAYRIPLVVDGSQSAVHLPVDVQALGCDFYCFTGHKTYGPTGSGVLWGKREWLEKLPPYEGGGEMIITVSEDSVTYNDPPHRFEAGTPAIVEAVGLGVALDYMMALGRENIAAHEAKLGDYARQRLGEMNSIKIFGKAREKGAIVSFEMKGAHAHDVATVIDRAGVAVRAGTHCAMPLLARYGVTSTCRASFGLYNTMEEVDKLVEALQKAENLFV